MVAAERMCDVKLLTSSIVASVGIGVPGLEGTRGDSSRDIVVVGGDNSDDFVISRVTSSFNPRKPRSPSSASELFD